MGSWKKWLQLAGGRNWGGKERVGGSAKRLCGTDAKSWRKLGREEGPGSRPCVVADLLPPCCARCVLVIVISFPLSLVSFVSLSPLLLWRWTSASASSSLLLPSPARAPSFLPALSIPSFQDAAAGAQAGRPDSGGGEQPTDPHGPCPCATPSRP